MPKKKKKISNLPVKLKKPVLLAFFVVVLVFSYNLGFQHGVNRAQMQTEQAGSDDRGQKVEKLTFFDSLHEPLQKNQNVAVKKPVSAAKVLPDITITEKVEDEPKQQESKTQVAKTVEVQKTKAPKKIAELKKEPVKKPTSKPTQKNKTKSVDELKSEPWAVQVGAFQDGMKAVLLRKELEKKGFGAYTLTVKHENLEIFRVMVAAASESISERINQDLQKDGYSSSFVIKR